VLALQTNGTTAVTVDASQNVTLAGTLTTTGVTTFQAGTAALPAITTTGDTNTGIFFPAADTIAFSEGGAEAMRIDSSGNLGLGVTPSTNLANSSIEINKAGNGLSVFSNTDFRISRNVIDSGAKYARSGETALTHILGNGTFAWYNAPSGTAGNTITFTQAMTLDASGNLGVGTTSIGTRLVAAGTGQSLVGTAFNVADFTNAGQTLGTRVGYDSSNGAVIASSGVDKPIAFWQYSSASSNYVERARIDSSGNLAVGTTTASAKLTVDSGSAGIYGYFNSTNANGGYLSIASSGTIQGDIGTASQIVSGGANTDFGINARGSRNLILGTNNAERARIDSSGNLCLNTTGYNNGKIVRVDDTDARVRSMIVNNNNSGSSSRCGYIVNAFGNSWAMEMGSSAANSNALNWTVDIFGSPTVRMALTVGGAATNSTGSWGTISDIRLKENVVDATPKLDGLMQLRVVNYNLKTDPDVKMLGFVAQEVEQVFPGLVDNDGEATGDGDFYKSVKTTVLVPMLIKAMQEQQALITQLQADVAALKGATA